MNIYCFKSIFNEDTSTISIEVVGVQDQDITELVQYKYNESEDALELQEKNFKESGMRTSFDVNSDWIKVKTVNNEIFSLSKNDLNNLPQLKDRYQIVEV